MPPTPPYTRHLGDREPIASMRATSERIRSLTSGWSPPQFERTYAPGKWTARQILTHLAETDMALGYRVRMALSHPGGAAVRSGRVDCEGDANERRRGGRGVFQSAA